jgi:hypothetical protein
MFEGRAVETKKNLIRPARISGAIPWAPLGTPKKHGASAAPISEDRSQGYAAT